MFAYFNSKSDMRLINGSYNTLQSVKYKLK